MPHLRVAGLMLVVLFMPFATRLSDAAEEPVVTPLLLKELPDISGKEALMITVNYPPGAPIQSIVTMLTHSSTSLRAPS